MRMILFVGDRPSERTDPIVPFKGAACEKRLMEWINFLVSKEDWYLVTNRASGGFGYLVPRANALQYPIVALGNNASKALKKIPHFKLPHPSGRNRQINNKEFIEKKLKDCKKWIYNE